MVYHICKYITFNIVNITYTVVSMTYIILHVLRYVTLYVFAHNNAIITSNKCIVTYICDKMSFLYVIYTYISFCNTNNRFRQPYKYEFCHTCIIFCATDMNACDNCVIVYRYIHTMLHNETHAKLYM